MINREFAMHLKLFFQIFFIRHSKRPREPNLISVETNPILLSIAVFIFPVNFVIYIGHLESNYRRQNFDF